MALLTSAVSLFYYFRVVKVMYLRDTQAERKVTLTWNEKIAVAVTTLGTLAVGIYPTPLLDFIRSTFS